MVNFKCHLAGLGTLENRSCFTSVREFVEMGMSGKIHPQHAQAPSSLPGTEGTKSQRKGEFFSLGAGTLLPLDTGT
jgi:hypothetical protein